MWGQNKAIWRGGSPEGKGRGAVNANNEILPEEEFRQKRFPGGYAKRCGEWNRVVYDTVIEEPPPEYKKKEGWLFVCGYSNNPEYVEGAGDLAQRLLHYHTGELYYDAVNEIFTDKWDSATAWTLSDSVVSRRISADPKDVGETFVDPNWDNTVYGGVEWSINEPIYEEGLEPGFHRNLKFNSSETISTKDWREKLLFNEDNYYILGPTIFGYDYILRFDYQSLTKNSYDTQFKKKHNIDITGVDFVRDASFYKDISKYIYEPSFCDFVFSKGSAISDYIPGYSKKFILNGTGDTNLEHLKVRSFAFNAIGTNEFFLKSNWKSYSAADYQSHIWFNQDHNSIFKSEYSYRYETGMGRWNYKDASPFEIIRYFEYDNTPQKWISYNQWGDLREVLKDTFTLGISYNLYSYVSILLDIDIGFASKPNYSKNVLSQSQTDVYFILSSNDYDITKYEYNPFFQLSVSDVFSTFNHHTDNYIGYYKKIKIYFFDLLNTNIENTITESIMSYNKSFELNNYIYYKSTSMMGEHDYSSYYTGEKIEFSNYDTYGKTDTSVISVNSYLDSYSWGEDAKEGSVVYTFTLPMRNRSAVIYNPQKFNYSCYKLKKLNSSYKEDVRAFGKSPDADRVDLLIYPHETLIAQDHKLRYDGEHSSPDHWLYFDDSYAEYDDKYYYTVKNIYQMCLYNYHESFTDFDYKVLGYAGKIETDISLSKEEADNYTPPDGYTWLKWFDTDSSGAANGITLLKIDKKIRIASMTLTDLTLYFVRPHSKKAIKNIKNRYKQSPTLNQDAYLSSSLLRASYNKNSLNHYTKYNDINLYYTFSYWNIDLDEFGRTAEYERIIHVTTVSPIMRPWKDNIITFTGLTPKKYNEIFFKDYEDRDNKRTNKIQRIIYINYLEEINVNYYNRFYKNGTPYQNYLIEGIYPDLASKHTYFVNSFVTTIQEGFSGVQIKLNGVYDEENLRISNAFNLPCDTALIAKVNVSDSVIVKHANVFTKDNDLGYDINKGIFPVIKSFWIPKKEEGVTNSVENAIFAIETQHLIEGPKLYFSHSPNDMPPGLEENYIGYKSRGLLISVCGGGTYTNYFVGEESGFFKYFPEQNTKRYPINANRAYDDDPWELAKEVGYYWQFEEAFNRLEVSGEYTFATQLAAKMSFGVRLCNNTSVLFMLAYDIDKWKPDDDDKPTKYEFIINPEEEFSFKAAYFTAEFGSVGNLVSFPHKFKDFQIQKTLRPLVTSSRNWTSSKLKDAGREFFVDDEKDEDATDFGDKGYKGDKKEYEGITIPKSLQGKKWGARVWYEFDENDKTLEDLKINRGVIRLVRWRTYTWKEKKVDKNGDLAKDKDGKQKYIEHQDAIAECAVAYTDGQTTKPDNDYVDLFYTGKDTILLRFYRDDSKLETKKKKNAVEGEDYKNVEICVGDVCVENMAIPELMVWQKATKDDTGKVSASKDYLLKLSKLGIFDVITLQQPSEEEDPDESFEVLAIPVVATAAYQANDRNATSKTYFCVSKDCKNWEITGVIGDGFLSHTAAGDKSTAPSEEEKTK